MTIGEEMPADQLLAKLFEVVLDEARSNRTFAEKLVGALPVQVVARIETGRRKPAKPTEPQEQAAFARHRRAPADPG
jgi:hypothetical protein